MVLIGFTSEKTLTQAQADAYEVVTGEKVKVSFFAEGRGNATVWTMSGSSNATIIDKTDDSCVLDTGTAAPGGFIEVTGTAGNLVQKTKYKILAKV